MRKLILLVIIMLFVIAGSLLAETVGKIRLFRGNVMVKTSPNTKWSKAKINMKLEDTAMIKVAKGASIQIKLKDGSTLTLNKRQIIRMSNLIKTKKNTKLTSLAKLRLLKNKLDKGTGSGLDVPTAVAGVRGADVSEEKSPISPTDLIWEE